MKKGIHPKWNKQVKVLHNGKHIMTVGSTSPELNVEIWAGNHPFYTGKEALVDTDDLVSKFNEKLKKVNTSARSKKQKKAKRRERAKSTFNQKQVTLKDMLDQVK